MIAPFSYDVFLKVFKDDRGTYALGKSYCQFHIVFMICAMLIQLMES